MEKSDSEKIRDLHEIFGLGVDWSKLDSEDLDKVHSVTEDPEARIKMVRRVAKQLDSHELADILRAAAEEAGGPVLNVFL